MRFSLHECMVKKNFFLRSLNESVTYIKLTYQSNKENTFFLDIKVSLGNDKVFVDVYVKPTDSRHYLH